MNRREFAKGSLALAGAAVFNIGCTKEAATESKSDKGTTKERAKKMNKPVVVYFSWSGNTRFAATTIAKKVEASTFEIKAETPYNSDFQKCCDEAKPECNGKKSRPIKAIEGLDLSKYDMIFVGSPDWWGTLAPPVRTWVTQNVAALKGKTVCLFQTHGGGGMQNLGRDFAALLPESNVLSPKAFSGSSVKSSVKALEELATDRMTVK